MKQKKKHRIQYFLFILIIIVIPILIRKEVDSSIIIDASVPKNNETIKVKEMLYNESSSFPTDVYGVPVYTELIDINENTRPGIKRKIKYIVIHETDNFEAGVGAKNHARFLKTNIQTSTSWHYTVDDKEIYHHIPDNEIAYHAADEIGNEYGIGIELCVNRDGNFEKTFENATKLVAYLLKEYDLTIDDIKTHCDFSGKDCPHTILKQNRIGEFKRKCKQIKTAYN